MSGNVNAFMLDLETLDTKSTAVITSIALQQFDPTSGELGGYLHLFLPVEPQVAAGRTMSDSTLRWWQQQTTEAQLKILEGRKYSESIGYTCDNARNDVGMALKDCTELWACGPDFDCVILQDFMQMTDVGRGFKWPYWAHRCLRTARHMADGSYMRHAPEVAHDALSDCHAQIKDVVSIIKHFNNAQYTPIDITIND